MSWVQIVSNTQSISFTIPGDPPTRCVVEFDSNGLGKVPSTEAAKILKNLAPSVKILKKKPTSAATAVADTPPKEGDSD